MLIDWKKYELIEKILFPILPYFPNACERALHHFQVLINVQEELIFSSNADLL